MAVSELGVTLPNYPAVLAVGVRDLAPVPFTGAATNDFPRKNASTIVLLDEELTPGKFLLNHLKHISRDDGGVAVLHVILRHLAFIDLHRLVQEVGAEALLQENVSLVLFVGEDAQDGVGWPLLFSCRRGNCPPP